MHAAPEIVFHRDIRWPNIIRDAHDPLKWFLIDWDDAEQPPTRATKHLSPDSHSPNVFKDGHGAEVDIWGVGRLILDAGSFATGISQDFIQTGKGIMENEEMTAEQALIDLHQENPSLT